MEIAKCAIFALSSYCWPITASRGFCDKRISSKNVLLLVFSVTPFKIDQNKNQNRSIDKVQNLGNERRYIYKDPRQDSGQRIFRIRDIRRNVLPKLIEICMETPCWCSPG